VYNGQSVTSIPRQVSICTDNDVAYLGRDDIENVLDQRFAPVFNQALVVALHAHAPTAGQDDAAEFCVITEQGSAQRQAVERKTGTDEVIAGDMKADVVVDPGAQENMAQRKSGLLLTSVSGLRAFGFAGLFSYADSYRSHADLEL